MKGTLGLQGKPFRLGPKLSEKCFRKQEGQEHVMGHILSDILMCIGSIDRRNFKLLCIYVLLFLTVENHFLGLN
jgi:hypothetical protein